MVCVAKISASISNWTAKKSPHHFWRHKLINELFLPEKNDVFVV